jgi:hypothetical protein
MALLGAVDLFGRIVRNAIDIAVTILAFSVTMRTAVEDLLIDIVQSELTGFVDPAQAPVFMAKYTVEFIVGLSRTAENQQKKRGQHMDE